ncbi:MAG TPA: GDSL-type esterase/lipase family protein [Solirubrobacter sp.]|nr:GDSL-type esterase/lipase family protein [Solirubrobacter sp.]
MARDDSLMERFEQHGLSRFRARDAVWAVLLVSTLLVVLAGDSARRAGEQMNPGIGRDLVLLVGKPAGAIADALPFARLADKATAWASPDEALNGQGSFATLAASPAGIPPVTPDAFTPAQLGTKPPAPRPLKRVLVTGDSMSTPLDTSVARALAGTGVKVTREPHLGSGISKSFLVDWGELSSTQVRKLHPDAVVVFIGANEGFPFERDGREIKCCGAPWAAEYANRVRAMMNTYRADGRARVYWVKLPTVRSKPRSAIGRVVNAAIDVAAEPWKSQVRVIDTIATFTPNGYRDAMEIDGQDTIVRQPDGIHFNDAGSAYLARIVLDRVRQDFAVER